jgi:hypothetical protein
VCEGAKDALVFLTSQGLDATTPVTIDVLPKLPEVCGTTAAGCYLESERRVLILTYAELAKRESWFRLLLDLTLYRSLVSHEVAHAIAARNFRRPAPTITAKEYVAYVTMFSTMAPSTRARVLGQFQGEAFEGDWQMHTIIYLADPMRFGVRAYRHFLKHDDGRNYLHALLRGEVLRDSD